MSAKPRSSRDQLSSSRSSVPPRPSRAPTADAARRRSRSPRQSSDRAFRSQDWAEERSAYQPEARPSASYSAQGADSFADDTHWKAQTAAAFDHENHRRSSGVPQGLASSLSRGAPSPSRLRTVSFDYPGTSEGVRLPWGDAPATPAVTSPSPTRRDGVDSTQASRQSREYGGSGAQEGVQHSGWLFRGHGHGTHREWKRQWVCPLIRAFVCEPWL